MIFVAKTIQQLEQALKNNAQEIMIVGKQAPEILETIRRSAANEDSPLYPVVSRLNNNFEVLELVDNTQQVEGILHLKNNPHF